VTCRLNSPYRTLLTQPTDDVLYCERLVEYLSDLQSQLPTRRYVNTLLHDLHVLPAIRLSPMFNDESNSLIRDQQALLSHYTHFTIDDQTGVQYTQTEAYDKHCITLSHLQRVSLKHFKDKLTVLALSNYGSIDKRTDLEALLEPLTNDELTELISLLNIRNSFPESLNVIVDRKFLLEILLSRFERQKTFQEVVRDMSLIPTEQTLFDRNVIRADIYDGIHPLALPKLNLQYLSIGDFLWRSLILSRCEAFYGIRKDIEAAITRLRPDSKRPGDVQFSGFSRMALPISKPT
jgi:intron-binding protein aquarius